MIREVNMPFCLNCDKRDTCKEICPELEAVLPKPRGGGHKKEFPVDIFKIRDMADNEIGREYTCGGGKRKKHSQED